MAKFRFQWPHPESTLDVPTFLELWTLSLAPLLAHILAGVPKEVVLGASRPSWLDRIVLWNPTSIIWRYFVIFDRRVRCKSWDESTMAASNALFWTEAGWQGGEDFLLASKPYCVRLPDKRHVNLSSMSFAQTVIVTLQGFQALYQLVLVHEFQRSYANLATIFLPIALIGIVRLPAAYWLSEDFAYAQPKAEILPKDSPTPKSGHVIPSEVVSAAVQPHPARAWTISEGLPDPRATYHLLCDSAGGSSSDSNQAMEPPSSGANSEAISLDMHPRSSIRGCVVRYAFLAVIIGMALISIVYWYLMEKWFELDMGATGWLMLIFYLIYTNVTLIAFVINIAATGNRSTVLRGVTSTAYKIYTIFLFLLAITLFIVASMETRKTQCGTLSATVTFLPNCPRGSRAKRPSSSNRGA